MQKKDAGGNTMEATKEAFFDKLDTEQQAVQIPYYLHEGEMYRLERLNKRWFIAFLVVLIMLFVTNGAWIAYEMMYETYYVEQDVDTGSAPAVVAGVGDAIYGEDKTDNKSAGEEDQRIKSDQTVPDM